MTKRAEVAFGPRSHISTPSLSATQFTPSAGYKPSRIISPLSHKKPAHLAWEKPIHMIRRFALDDLIAIRGKIKVPYSFSDALHRF